MKEEVEAAKRVQEEELRIKIEEDYKRGLSEQVRREEIQKLESVNNDNNNAL